MSDLSQPRIGQSGDYAQKALVPNDRESITACGLVPLFTGDEISTVACQGVAEGDVLLHTPLFDVILRPTRDTLTFSIIGGAIVLRQYDQHYMSYEDCECWPTDSDTSYVWEPINIALQLSNEEVFRAVLLRKSLGHGISSFTQDVLDYVQRESFGVMKAGTLCRDVSASDRDENRDLGPPQSLCPLHRSAEYHRRRRNALFYSALSEGGSHVAVRKQELIS